jgi:uncharacterized repeat protein (TIGR03803 family)
LLDLRRSCGIAAFAFFAITLALSAHAQTVKVLYSFPGGTGGGFPVASLVFDPAGNLYGTTKNFGAACNCGTVFELSPTATGWQQTILYTFTGGADGANPASNLIFDAAGNLYGTTLAGGNLGDCTGSGCGVVFRLSPSTTGVWTETVLHTFTEGTDGGVPAGGLVFDSAGNLYGVTTYDGSLNLGLVFELSPTSSGSWKEVILHHFGHLPNDGFSPLGGISVDSKGILYGTTSLLYGAVYQLVPAKSGHWSYTNLRHFNGYPDGRNPAASVVSDTSGNLFTTTQFEGQFARGAVVELTRTNQVTTEKVIHSFKRTNDGENPVAGLSLDAAGNLYGTCPYGGSSGNGVVFKLLPHSDGTWSESIISFSGANGAQPHAGLIQDTAGNFYGTTLIGGANGYGVVYEVTP